jgi:predicted Zn-dependent protease
MDFFVPNVEHLRMKNFLFALLFALPLAAQNLPVADAAEIKLGESAVTKFMELQGAGTSPQVEDIEKFLQQVGDRVAAHTKRKMRWTFHLDPDPRFKSAVSLPGGQVIVGGGILSLIDREDELAIVLGHEIAHIDLGQVNQRIADEMKERHLTLEQLDQIPAGVWGTNYGTEKETAADNYGIHLAVAAGYSPYAAVRILDVFRYFFSQDEEKAKKYLPQIVSRIDSANELIKKEHWESLTKQTTLDF